MNGNIYNEILLDECFPKKKFWLIQKIELNFIYWRNSFI